MKLKLGDININLLNCHIDNKISDHYLDMLLDLGYMPLITCTKATRVIDHTATLIDLIQTNDASHKITKEGIGLQLAVITDHLPIFCSVTTRLSLRQKVFPRLFLF